MATSVLVGVRGAGRYVKTSLPRMVIRQDMDAIIDSICALFMLGEDDSLLSYNELGYIVSIWVVVPAPDLTIAQRKRLLVKQGTQLRTVLSRPSLQDRLIEIDIRHVCP